MFSNEDKQSAFRKTATKLRKLAKDLGIPKENYEVRPCYGGFGVGGEAILHADNLYINAPLFKNEGTCYFRSCNGRKDYSGGSNQYPKGQIPTVEEVRRAIPAFRN